ncbi:MAG: GNAT family N-acetyltransferase [Candidatus Promineifilaceae bacterium]|nr:GNAT family N-acetyltransferase [Candidatus Promineifilaceae bacterium]
MRRLRSITENELDDFVTISVYAYPGIGAVSAAELASLYDRLLRAYKHPLVHLYALFENGEMRDVMRMYDFTIKLLSTKALVGGVGGVAVALTHKKEKIATDMLIYELVYDTSTDLAQILSFLRSQEDQIENIIFNTQDEGFHFLLGDPRSDAGKMLPQVTYHESNIQGVGIMYRVINLPQLFKTLENHNFGDVTCRLQINLSDTFMPANSGRYQVNFIEGRPSLSQSEEYDVAVEMDVSEFSSLVVGAVDFQKLYEYGLAAISNADQVEMITRLFRAPRPLCLTRF